MLCYEIYFSNNKKEEKEQSIAHNNFENIVMFCKTDVDIIIFN